MFLVDISGKCIYIILLYRFFISMSMSILYILYLSIYDHNITDSCHCHYHCLCNCSKNPISNRNSVFYVYVIRSFCCRLNIVSGLLYSIIPGRQLHGQSSRAVVQSTPVRPHVRLSVRPVNQLVSQLVSNMLR